MTASFTFSYIVIEKRLKEAQNAPLVSVYPFWISNKAQAPIRILRSLIPAITAKIYSGSFCPESDYTEAIERQIKLDIQKKPDYDALTADQINDQDWHLKAIIPSSD
jgi:hypothetical protein